MSFVNDDDRFTFVDEVDFMEITFFGGLYEQVLYYEAFYSTIGNQPWVDGVFTERWD